MSTHMATRVLIQARAVGIDGRLCSNVSSAQLTVGTVNEVALLGQEDQSDCITSARMAASHILRNIVHVPARQGQVSCSVAMQPNAYAV